MTEKARPTVLIADDHPIWRSGLHDLLEPTFEVVSEAANGGEAVDKALLCKPDVVVMDVCMPGMDGIAAVRQIKEALPDTGVVMLSGVSDDEQIHESIQAGANGFLAKDDPPELVIEAVSRAVQGQNFLSPDVTNRVMQQMRSPDAVRNGGFSLSPRELEVLHLVAEGHRYKEIARLLGISTRTVGNHVTHIYNKLGVEDRAQVVLYAVRKGIVRP